MGRPLKTKIAALITPAKGRVHEEARLQDKATQTLRKQRHDKKNATPTTITPGDKVLIKPYQTTEKHGKTTLQSKAFHSDESERNTG